MVGRFMAQHLVLLIGAIVIAGAAMRNEESPAWRKIAKSGRIVEPNLISRSTGDNGKLHGRIIW